MGTHTECALKNATLQNQFQRTNNEKKQKSIELGVRKCNKRTWYTLKAKQQILPNEKNEMTGQRDKKDVSLCHRR